MKCSKLLEKITGKQIQARYDPPRNGDIRDSQADISLARKMLGYEPLVHFEEGLSRTWEWYKSAYPPRFSARANLRAARGGSFVRRLLSAIELMRQFLERVDHYVGRMRAQAFGSQAIADAAGPDTRIARRANIHVGIADHHGFPRQRAEVAQHNFHAHRVGLFPLKTVSAVHKVKIARKSQAFEYPR